MKSRKIKIVMYHYVRKIAGSRYPGIRGLEYELFCEQIAWLRSHYQLITMEDALWQAESSAPVLPENACLLTFDDGYKDHYEYVYPVLKQNRIQGSFFACAQPIVEKKVLDVNKIHFILAGEEITVVLEKLFAILDKYRRAGQSIPENEILFRKLAVPERFDPKEVIFVKRLLQNELPERLRNDITGELFQECLQIPEEEFSQRLYMNLEELQEMKDGGMYIGPHGYKHYWLGEIPAQEMKTEIETSLAVLDGLYNRDGWAMNYPYGSYNQDTIEYIRSRGCKLAFATEVGNAVLDEANRYCLPRFDTNDFPPKSRGYEAYI